MQRFVALAETQISQQPDYGLKVANHAKKLDLSKLENKQELSNLSKDRQAFSAILKEEIRSAIGVYIRDLEEDFRAVKSVVEAERKNGQQLVHELNLLKTGICKGSDNQSKTPATTLKRTPSNQSNASSDIKILHLESQIGELNKINQQLKPQKQAQPVSRQIFLLKNELKLEIAHLRDGLLDIEDTYRSRFQKLELGNTNLLRTFQYGIQDLTQKYTTITQQLEKNSIDVERYNAELDGHNNKIQSIQKLFKELDKDVDARMDQSRKAFEARLVEAEELFQESLQKVIVPYNSNFQEVDKSIIQLKEIVKDVLKFTKNLGDKLATKLNNTIDAATFQKTIQNLNQSFNQTYLLNTQKIKELNQKEYEVYHELNQVKDVLENLKVEYNSANKLCDEGKNPFQKKVTSLGDLGIDSDYDDRELKQEDTQEPELPNPFKKKTERSLEESFD